MTDLHPMLNFHEKKNFTEHNTHQGHAMLHRLILLAVSTGHKACMQPSNTAATVLWSATVVAGGMHAHTFSLPWKDLCILWHSSLLQHQSLDQHGLLHTQSALKLSAMDGGMGGRP